NAVDYGVQSNDDSAAEFRTLLTRYYYPFLVVWGTVGNVLCLKVLLRKKFLKNSTCQYLAVLAVIDILFIYTRSSRYLYRYFFSVDLRNTSKWICRIFIFFSSALSHIASWILVVVSFDRYLIITNRYRRRSVDHRVLLSTMILIIVVCFFNAHYFFILGKTMTFPRIDRSKLSQFNLTAYSSLSFDSSSHEETSASLSQLYIPLKNETRFVCIARDDFDQFFRLYIPIFDILLVAAVPFLLLCFSNLSIIVFTMRTNRALQRRGVIRKQSHRRHQRLTVMLLSVTCVFLCLTCPSVIYICVNKIMYSGSSTQSMMPAAKLFTVDILESLWYTKHAINFILYTLSGSDFRREFLKLFQCCCCFNRPLQLTKLIKQEVLVTVVPPPSPLSMIVKQSVPQRVSTSVTNNPSYQLITSYNEEKLI
ncbi:unnamed protein product, partial [Didymodactylos carnosus]